MPNINKETKEAYKTEKEQIKVKKTEETEKEIKVNENPISVTEKTEEETEKKVRKPREKVRDVKETIELPVNKLTDKEKNNLIKALKEENTLLANKIDALNKLSDSAFNQTRETEKNLDAMEQYYKTALKSVGLQMDAAYAAIKNITGGMN